MWAELQETDGLPGLPGLSATLAIFVFFFLLCCRQGVHPIFRSSGDANWAVRRRSSTVPYSLVATSVFFRQATSVLFRQVFLHRSPQFGGQVCVARPGFPTPFLVEWGRFGERDLGAGLIFHMDTRDLSATTFLRLGSHSAESSSCSPGQGPRGKNARRCFPCDVLVR